jgi:hypothetical protein
MRKQSVMNRKAINQHTMPCDHPHQHAEKSSHCTENVPKVLILVFSETDFFLRELSVRAKAPKKLVREKNQFVSVCTKCVPMNNHTAFSSTLKAKVGSTLTKSSTLRITLKLMG